MCYKYIYLCTNIGTPKTCKVFLYSPQKRFLRFCYCDGPRAGRLVGPKTLCITNIIFRGKLYLCSVELLRSTPRGMKKEEVCAGLPPLGSHTVSREGLAVPRTDVGDISPRTHLDGVSASAIIVVNPTLDDFLTLKAIEGAS